jgi:hypothetical protein
VLREAVLKFKDTIAVISFNVSENMVEIEDVRR